MKETRTYEVTAYKCYLDKLEELFAYIENLGRSGASRIFKVGVDGDGCVCIQFKKEGTPVCDISENREKLKQKTENGQKDIEFFGFS